MGRSVWLVGLACLVGCEARVNLLAMVTASREGSEPAAGWEVEVFGRDLTSLAKTSTDASGMFSVDLPQRTWVHLVFSSEQTLPIAFSGETGQLPEFKVPAQSFWGFSAQEAAAWRERFAGCPGAEVEDNGLIVGITYPDMGEGYPYEGSPPDPNGLIYFHDPLADDATATRQDACYLDSDGVALDTTRTTTGRSGQYALFGVGGQSGELVTGAVVGASGENAATALGGVPTWVPEGGAVVRIPTLVPLQ